MKLVVVELFAKPSVQQETVTRLQRRERRLSTVSTPTESTQGGVAFASTDQLADALGQSSETITSPIEGTVTAASRAQETYSSLQRMQAAIDGTEYTHCIRNHHTNFPRYTPWRYQHTPIHTQVFKLAIPGIAMTTAAVTCSILFIGSLSTYLAAIGGSVGITLLAIPLRRLSGNTQTALNANGAASALYQQSSMMHFPTASYRQSPIVDSLGIQQQGRHWEIYPPTTSRWIPLAPLLKQSGYNYNSRNMNLAADDPLKIWRTYRHVANPFRDGVRLLIVMKNPNNMDCRELYFHTETVSSSWSSDDIMQYAQQTWERIWHHWYDPSSQTANTHLLEQQDQAPDFISTVAENATIDFEAFSQYSDPRALASEEIAPSPLAQTEGLPPVDSNSESDSI